MYRVLGVDIIMTQLKKKKKPKKSQNKTITITNIQSKNPIIKAKKNIEDLGWGWEVVTIKK